MTAFVDSFAAEKNTRRKETQLKNKSCYRIQTGNGEGFAQEAVHLCVPEGSKATFA